MYRVDLGRAALARAGFGDDVARRVIEAKSPGDVEAGIGTAGTGNVDT